MKISKLIFLFPFLLCGIARAALTPVGPISFGKGLNVATIETDIADDESPDMSNMINDRQGGAFKRNGSKRYIDQAYSTFPVTSLYRAYASTGTDVKKVTFASIGKNILISTSDLNSHWIVIATVSVPNQHFSFVTANNLVIFTGDALTDPIMKYDIIASSFSNLITIDGSSTSINVRAKYLLWMKNYLVAVNCSEVTNGTTYYPNRIYYSLLVSPIFPLNISSFTAQRFIDVRTDDGDELMGAGIMYDKMNLFKRSSIFEIDFTVLNVPSLGGDWILRQLVSGYGVIASRSLINTGQFYAFMASDGERVWDGGRRARLTVAEESRIISYKVKPIFDDLIRAGTYKNIAAVYFKKKEQMVLSYEDPNKFPRGKLNSILVYDFQTSEWFPYKNWLAESLTTFDGPTDKGELLYGDSNDGYAFFADLETESDDARKEISVHNMDNQANWTGSSQDLVNVKEGTASLKITLNPAGAQSSMTYVAVINAGEWYDKTKVSKDDKLAFKVFATTISNISSLRIDVEVNDVLEGSVFDTNFTSVTLSSASLTGGNTNWTSVEIALSSFPIRPDWTNLDSELVPFANTLTFYGVRFVLNGVSSAAVSIDDLRIVQGTKNPLNVYRKTKLFNFGSATIKEFPQVLVTREKSADSNFFMDIYNDFGALTRTEEFKSEIPKEIFVLGFNNSTGVFKLSSIDFTLKDSTVTPFPTFNGVADRKYVYFADRTNNRMVKVDRSSMTVFVSTYGSFGSGTTNFNLVHQQALDEDNLFLLDLINQRLKVHSLSNFGFLKQYGSLGTGATSFHQPLGVAVDANNIFIADEGNYRLVSFTKSTFSYIVQAPVDYNTIGDSSLAVDESNLYLAYDKVSEANVEFLDVILERRDKTKMSLVNRIAIRPENSVALSTYSLMGDIALLGEYIFIPFTDNGNFDGTPGNYYIQKRLKSDFSLVKEYRSTNRHFSVIGDGLAYKSSTKNEAKDIGTSGKYLQLKFYDNAMDNNFKLFNMTFSVDAHEFILEGTK